MGIKSLAKQIYSIVMLVLTFSVTAFAQTDAERFAEGRVAIDKFNDCPAALKALEAVSEEGRKNPLWVFYMARANECLNRFSDALRYYVEYDRMVPGQAAVLDKIGELRYQSGVQQRKEEAERARARKVEEDKRALDSEKEEAKARLGIVLQALNNELNTSWKYKANNDKALYVWTITTSSQPSCEFRFTIRREIYTSYGGDRTFFESVTEAVTLNLTKVQGMYFSGSVLHLYADRKDSDILIGSDYFIKGSSEEVSKSTTTDKKDRINDYDRTSKKSLPYDFSWAPNQYSYGLTTDESLSKEFKARLKQAFEIAVATCKKAEK